MAQTRSGYRSCYLAYPRGIDIRPVLESLAEMGVRVIDTTSLEPGPTPRAESIQAQIAGADVLVGVLSGSARDSAVLFEVGVARGLGKPVIVLAASRASLPSELTGVPIIRVDWRNKAGLNLAIQRVSGTQIRLDKDESIDNPKSWPAARHRWSCNQLDWHEVPGRPPGKVEFPPQRAIQLLGITSGQTASVVNCVFAEPCHLVHVAQHGAVLRLCQCDIGRVENAESFQRETLGLKLLVN